MPKTRLNGRYIERGTVFQRKLKFLFAEDMVVLKKLSSNEDGMRIQTTTQLCSISNLW